MSQCFANNVLQGRFQLKVRPPTCRSCERVDIYSIFELSKWGYLGISVSYMK